MKEVKKYLSFGYKKALVDAIVNRCVYEVDNVYFVDVMDKDFWTHKFILEAYAGIEFADEVDTLEQYDAHVESGTLKEITDAIGNEYYILLEAIDASIDAKLKSFNSVEGVIGRVGSKLLKMLEDFTNGISPEKVDQMKNALETFDFSKLSMLTELLGDGGGKSANKQRRGTSRTPKKNN